MSNSVTNPPVKTTKTLAPATWQPGSMLASLRREIDRVFESLPNRDWAFPFARSTFDFDLPRLPTAGDWEMRPAVDVAEKDKEYETRSRPSCRGSTRRTLK